MSTCRSTDPPGHLRYRETPRAILPPCRTLMRGGLALICGLTVLLAAAPTQAAALQPNLIIILADDLGYGDLSCYGGAMATPHIDLLAAEGLRFTDFHASGPVCSPTRAGLLTGRYQQRAGIEGVVFADPSRPEHHHGLQASEVTLPALLHRTGYATAITGKWHLGYKTRYNPIHRGFQHFRGFVSGNVDYISKVDGAGAYDWWHQDQVVEEEGYVTRLITQHSVQFIERHHAQPFFLLVSHAAPHYPYQAPDDAALRAVGQARPLPNDDPQQIQRGYKAHLAELDRSVGQIVQTLQRLQIAERTLVFFLSDNGANAHGSNEPLRGFKGQLWEGGHRVPAIAWGPGRIRSGRQVDQFATSLDLMPTCLALAGLDAPSDHPLDGRDLSRLLLDGTPPDERPFFWAYGRQRAMRSGDWKLLINAPRTGTPALFHLGDDPAETTDLSSRHPERVRRMAQAVEEWYERTTADATPQPTSD